MAVVAERPVDRHFNPRWLMTVARERGLPGLEVRQVEAALRKLGPTELELLREQVQRLHRGTESGDDMTALSKWLDRARAEEPPADRQREAANEESRQRHTPKVSPAAPPERWGMAHHVYGTKAGICFEPTTISPADPEREEPFHTLMIEMAEAQSRKRFDWERKISLRLTRRELPLFAAWLLGWCPALEFSGHGQGNDKVLHLEDQSSHLFVRLRQGRRVLAAQIGGEELAAIGSMVLKALHLNAPYMDSQAHLHLVRRAGTMYARSTGSDPA